MINDLTQRKISIAPMIDYTHRHFRYFFRLLTQHSLLYTEMITTQAILRSDNLTLLNFNQQELPVAFQLGGSDPFELSQSVKQIEKAGYSEVNLNLGCPSSRVQDGAFGAILMKNKKLAVDCYKAMIDAVSIPATIKCRIGVDDLDSDEYFFEFIDALSQAGCNVFIVHARIAYLKGLSPKENRTIPPLNYQRVIRLKHRLPEATIILNGGLQNFQQLDEFKMLDGLMFGRKATQDPFYFREADHYLTGEENNVTREKVLEEYFPYFKAEVLNNQNVNLLLKPLQGLYFGQAGAKKFKVSLLEVARSSDPIKAYESLYL